jgi:cytolysin-activating lysine-acyltransferase
MTINSIPAPVLSPADETNGSVLRKPQVHDAEEMKRRAAMARDVSANFGQLVSLLMRSRAHRFSMLADLEYMVVPAIATRQFRVAEGVSAEAGLVAPVAAVMWGSVSAEVDQRLVQAVDQPIRLKPEEWRSGDIVWIVDAVGDPKAINALLQHLKQNELKDARVKMRIQGKDGKPVIGRVELQPEAAGDSGRG